MTQKLGLAACLALERELYVLDEPMSGLDPAARVAVKSVLQRLSAEGRTLLFTSHVLADVDELCSSIAVLERARLRFRGTPQALCARYAEASLERACMKIFVLSGQNDAANARHARALGAWEFVAKPSDPALLKRLLARALEAPAGDDADLVGESPALAKLKSQIAQFAASPYPVLIEGEPGSGKEIAARGLHRLPPRAGPPYPTPNCAAIAPTLVEPTLFGYAKGAFTGAATNKSGYFEDAEDGTL